MDGGHGGKNTQTDRGLRCYTRRQNTTVTPESQKQKYSAGYQDFQVEMRQKEGQAFHSEQWKMLLCRD